MSKLGDCVTGLIGGALTSYFLVAAAMVFFTGQSPQLGPEAPLSSLDPGNPIAMLAIRAVQGLIFAAIAVGSYLAFRFMQELLRGRPAKSAWREAKWFTEAWSRPR